MVKIDHPVVGVAGQLLIFIPEGVVNGAICYILIGVNALISWYGIPHGCLSKSLSLAL